MLKYSFHSYSAITMDTATFYENLPLKKAFGLTIRMLRYEANMSQEELAEKAHLHVTYLSSVETGKRSVGFEKIVDLARALGCSPKDLMPDH
jgi:transcriptional regulator with XRE-family HTH domain